MKIEMILTWTKLRTF